MEIKAQRRLAREEVLSRRLSIALEMLEWQKMAQDSSKGLQLQKDVEYSLISVYRDCYTIGSSPQNKNTATKQLIHYIMNQYISCSLKHVWTSHKDVCRFTITIAFLAALLFCTFLTKHKQYHINCDSDIATETCCIIYFNPGVQDEGSTQILQKVLNNLPDVMLSM